MSGKPLDIWAWVGLLLFVVVDAVLIAILLPLITWSFETDTKRILADYIEGDRPATLAEVRRSLAWHLNDARLANRTRLRRLNWAFIGAAVLLLLETVAFLVALWRVHA